MLVQQSSANSITKLDLLALNSSPISIVASHTISLDLQAFEGVVLVGARVAEKH